MNRESYKTIFFEEYDARLEVFREGPRNLWHCDLLVVRSQVFTGGSEEYVVRYLRRDEETPYLSVYSSASSRVLAGEAFSTVIKGDSGFEHAIFHLPDEEGASGRRLRIRFSEHALPSVRGNEGGGASNAEFLTRVYPLEGGARFSEGAALVFSVDFPAWFPLRKASYGEIETHAVAFYPRDTEEAGGQPDVLDEEETQMIQAGFGHYKLPYRRQKLKLVVVDPKPGRVYGLVWRRPASYELGISDPHSEAGGWTP